MSSDIVIGVVDLFFDLFVTGLNVSFVLMNHNYNEFFAFAVMLFMQDGQFRSLLIVTSWYLATSIVLNWCVYGKMGGFLLQVIISTPHWPGLNSMNQSAPIDREHVVIFDDF